MRRAAEALVFGAVAALVHLALVAVLFLSQETVVSAGASGGGATALGAPGDLTELIEAWESAPSVQSVDAQTDAPSEETAVDQPEAMQEVETAAVDAMDQTPVIPDAQTPLVEAVEQPVTPEAQPMDQPLAAVSPSMVTPQTPRTPVPAQPRTQPDALQAPETPTTQAPDTRAQEAEPDPNTVRMDLANLAPAAQDAPALPIPDQAEPERSEPERPVVASLPQQTQPLAPPEPAAVAPRVVEPEPEPQDKEPAPRVASLPVAKPRVPDWAKERPRQQPAKKAKKPKKQPAKKQPAKKQTAKKQPAKKQPAKTQPKPAAQAAASRTASQGSQSSTQQSSGGGAQAALTPGTGGSTTSGYSASQIKAAENAYVAAVGRAIKRKRRKVDLSNREERKIKRKPIVRVSIDRAGNLVGLTLSRSSGSKKVDKHILANVRRVGRFPAFPKEMKKRRVNISFPMPVDVK
ncbi:MAG: TonB family protein [Pseudomonadota bacterium]